MGISVRALGTIIAWFAFIKQFPVAVNGDLNYKDALTKSIIFLEAQRSGKLPPNHRPSWRGDSALADGALAQVDLVGGYYDAGDNVKYGLPMAFTVTTLAWGALFYGHELKAAGEMDNVLSGIRWGTDYFLKASSRRNRLYVQVSPLLLGQNPNGRSYMVGFGNNPPTQAHHRGASVPLTSENSDVSCGMSFVHFYNKDIPNPNELTGAIVGGPDRSDNFVDKRWDSPMTEPCTYVNSQAVGVLAKLASHGISSS